MVEVDSEFYITVHCPRRSIIKVLGDCFIVFGSPLVAEGI